MNILLIYDKEGARFNKFQFLNPEEISNSLY